MVLESPELVGILRDKYQSKVLTRRTGLVANIDLVNGTLEFPNGVLSVPKVGLAAQELIVEGGLENWVKNRIN
jgi:homoaconitate hydratase